MADVLTTAGAGAAAGAMSAASSGMPPMEVMVWAGIGGLVAVWLEHQAEIHVTPRWLFATVAQIFVSAASGVALSAAVMAIAPAFQVLQPAAAVPQWVTAGVIAALIHKAGPLAWGLVRGWLGRKGGNGNAP